MSATAAVTLAAIFDISGRTTILKVGWLQVSLANLIVLVLLIAVFVLAIVLPFPGRGARR